MDEKEMMAIPELAIILQDANHVDIKIVDGDVSMREFIAGMFNYYPDWMKYLYRIRGGFVRLLGMKQEGIPQKTSMKPTDVKMKAGEAATFFTVECAAEDHYWVASAAESHLTAYIGVLVEPLAQGNRFYLLTIVHYHNWRGRVYFNVIRPFHHIVVSQMAKAGVMHLANLQMMGGVP